MLETITNVNNAVNGVVWGTFGISLLLIAGIVMTIVNKGFQFSHFAHWMKKTIGAIFKEKSITAHTGKDNKAISQFQSLCTALAATIGTGNIVGVATAIVMGGPGSIFWMWIMAVFGMMTNYSENVLGIFYRRKGSNGEWHGGAMYYLRDGLGAYKGFKWIGIILAILFSCFCLLASFGIGNMSQVNSIAGNMDSAFHIPAWVTGIGLVILSSVVILGGLKRVASVTEKLVPFMAILYIIGALVVVFAHVSSIPAAFASIFKGAFQLKSATGGIVGYGVQLAITWGFKRGAFSNEAGLGSSVMVHSSSNVKEPVRQGMWGIFEVFADTIVVCTLTALVVLTSGLVDLETGTMLSENVKSALVGEAFGTIFGQVGPMFIAIAILLFAYSTVLGWSHYGTTAWGYLFGDKSAIIYKIVFVVMIFFGCTMSLDLAWDLSDTFNGLMMIPNLIGVLALCPVVAKITKNYVDRKLHNKDVKPMLSAFEDIQKEAEEEIKNEGLK
ncbi:MAG: alanine:cation symporter family protein [Treponema sp.]|nr:alanine:cation symporter family protein [Treponema sp.]